MALEPLPVPSVAAVQKIKLKLFFLKSKSKFTSAIGANCPGCSLRGGNGGGTASFRGISSGCRFLFGQQQRRRIPSVINTLNFVSSSRHNVFVCPSRARIAIPKIHQRIWLGFFDRSDKYSLNAFSKALRRIFFISSSNSPDVRVPFPAK